MERPPLILAEHLSKRFYATQALDDVSLALYPGEVHAIVGENGAGKSTLIKILGGIHQPDSGRVRVRGVERRFRNPREAVATGIVLIPQELRLVPAFTAAENVMLGHPPIRRALGVLPLIDRRRMREDARPVLGRLGFTADLDSRVDGLPYAEQQLVAIAKALSHQAAVLILDEPTAALERREVERLFETITTLKAHGVGIIYITHRLDEVIRIADRCTVLRDGRLVDVCDRAGLQVDRLTRLMTGRDLEKLHWRESRDLGVPLLEARMDGHAVSLRQREIAGLAGLLGSGTTALLKKLYGAAGRPLALRVNGRQAHPASPAQGIAAGMGFVPAERAEGLVMSLSVRDNIVLPNLDRLSRRLRLDDAAIDRLVERLVLALDIRPRDPRRIARELSGGNQRKVIFARWLAGNIRVLLLDEPTQGIDVGAKVQIHRLMHEFAADGGAILFASSEMTELLAIGDSVLAMRDGRIVARLDRSGDYTERALRALLGG